VHNICINYGILWNCRIILKESAGILILGAGMAAGEKKKSNRVTVLIILILVMVVILIAVLLLKGRSAATPQNAQPTPIPASEM